MYKRLARRILHRSPWLSLYQDDVEFPDGRILKDYHVVGFDHEFVACLARNANGEYLLVQQYRYPSNSVEWEIPGGGIEKDESIESAAQRELLEETGYKSVNHQLIYSYFPVNGNSNQKFNIMRCDVTVQDSDFDSNEIIKVKWHSKHEITDMIKRNIITDGYTLVALLYELSNIK